MSSTSLYLVAALYREDINPLKQHLQRHLNLIIQSPTFIEDFDTFLKDIILLRGRHREWMNELEYNDDLYSYRLWCEFTDEYYKEVMDFTLLIPGKDIIKTSHIGKKIEVLLHIPNPKGGIAVYHHTLATIKERNGNRYNVVVSLR